MNRETNKIMTRLEARTYFAEVTLPGAKAASTSAKKPTTTAKREGANAELVASNVGGRAQGRGKVK